MSKLGCTCGHVIRDQADALPCKAELFADQDHDRLWGGAAVEAGELAALPPDRRAAWIAARFGAPYPTDLPLDFVVADVLASAALPLRRTVYECESCGTLRVQASPGASRFQGYAPLDGNARGILRSLAPPDGA